MKIPASVRESYDNQRPKYEQLLETVDKELTSRIEKRWHYESRIKSPEGFALKLESGRFPDPLRLEDFFACTIVVNDRAAIGRAESIISGLYKVKYRRPETDSRTAKQSHWFPFDDLRIYVQYKDDPSVRPSGFDGVLFEVQIKTYLQHAWAIATHDLVYKSDTISWPKERIAYQVKAMLEHAELSIQEANQLSTSSFLPQEDNDSKRLLELIQVLRRHWAKDSLPQDVLHLARNVQALLFRSAIDLQELEKILDAETAQGGGPKLSNLSPYMAIVQSLLNQAGDKVSTAASRDPKKFRLLVIPELQVPTKLADKLVNVVKLPDQKLE